jgi:CheY-like chemotaxis protein
MTSPRTILVIDDEPSVRMIAKAILSGAGYAVTEASDPVAARGAVADAPQPFDLIFLDLGLAGENGASLIPDFRARAPGSRILVVSGASAEDADGLAADAFVSKPFTRAALLEAVRRVLAGA